MLKINAARKRQDTSPYLLEPNIKTSPGGLRDLHELQWVSLLRYHTNNLEQLFQWGRLTQVEYQNLTQARDFLWRIRNQMHFQNADDQLTVEQQEAVAAWLRFENRRTFMRQYYRMAGVIAEICPRFIREAEPKTLWHRFPSLWRKKKVHPKFYLLHNEIYPDSPHLDLFFEEDQNRLLLFLFAKEHQKAIPGSVLEFLHPLEAMPILSPQATLVFRQLLSKPGGIADTLRKMHQTQVLWQIIPEYARIHCLVQDSLSHFFTTDEHSFRAVEEAENLARESGPFGAMYAEIRRKDILHLALLLHDVGKGLEGDHSQIGSEVAKTVSQRLGLTEEELTLLTFLVHHHLLFSNVAFYRDFTNEPILLKFAREVGRPETLKMLLILTYADIRAVAPGAWNSWKGDLLLKLYNETQAILSGEELDTKKEETTLLRLEEATKGVYPDTWRSPVLKALTPRYLSAIPLPKIEADLSALYRLPQKPVQVTAQYDPDSKVTEYTLYTMDAPGLFSKMTGVLAARGLNIISAHIFTHYNGMVVDLFSVTNPDTQGPPSPEEIEAISSDIQTVLEGNETIPDLFLKRRRYAIHNPRVNPLSPLKVEVDNESSHFFTIIDIFAPDFPGLLYRIAKTIFELGLSVYFARIATRLDQIVDVFYVQEAQQEKVTLLERIKTIKSHIEAEIKTTLGTDG